MINSLDKLFSTFKDPGQLPSKLEPLPLWAKIVLVIIFVILGLMSIYFQKGARNKMNQFKEKQLEEYIKDNPRQKNVKYETSGLYLPAWQRAKYNLPLFMSVVFFSIAIIIFILILKS